MIPDHSPCRLDSQDTYGLQDAILMYHFSSGGPSALCHEPSKHLAQEQGDVGSPTLFPTTLSISICHRSPSTMSRGTSTLLCFGKTEGDRARRNKLHQCLPPSRIPAFKRVFEIKTTFTITLKDTLFWVYSAD